MKNKYQKLIFTIILLAGFFVYAKPAHALWYSSDWAYRRPITIQSSQVATTTSSFPVLATTTLADLKTTTNGGKVESDNGYDIVWTDSNGFALLAYEQESYASTTGEIVYWLEVDISSTTDKVLYMYYGKSGASDLSNATGVWDSDYKAVWHLPDNTALDTVDSTLYVSEGTLGGNASTTDSGNIDGSLQLDGTGDYVDFSAPAGLNPGAGSITAEVWIKTSDTPSWHEGDRVILRRDQSTGTRQIWGLNISGWENNLGSATMNMYYSGSRCEVSTVSSVTDGEWHHVVGVRDTANTNCLIYLDGVLKQTAGESTPLSNIAPSQNIGIGEDRSYPGTSPYFNGSIDEARVSTVLRSGGWILTQYNNQSDVASFMTFGSEEDYSSQPVLWYSSDWEYRRPVTIQSSQSVITTSSFPVLATTTLADLKTTTNGGKVESDNGYDIVWTDSDGTTLLAYEQESYASTTGEIVYWLEVDISSTTDKVLYMYYGKSGASDLSNATGVWDSDYKAVWHLREDQSGTGSTDTYQDSTTNANHGDDYVSATGQTGQIGNGNQFDGSDDYIGVPDHSSLDITSALTLSAWVNFSASGSRIIVKKSWEDNNAPNYGNLYRLSSWNGNGDTNVVRTTRDIYSVSGSATLSDSKWHYVTTVFDSSGNTLRFYVDGVQDGSDTTTAGTLYSSSAGLRIGEDEWYGSNFSGYIDEVRVSASARSAVWVLTEFTNQSDTASFMTFGMETSSASSVSSVSTSQGVRVKGGTRFKGGVRFK